MYYLLLLIISLLYLGIPKSRRARNKKYLNACFFVMLLISSLRGYTVGGDLSNYIPLFDEVSKTTFSNLFQGYTKYGYIFLCYIKITSWISSDPTFLLFATSLINLGGVVFFIRRYSSNYWFSLFIFITMAYYTNTFNSVRASMALSLGLIAIHFLLENKNWRYLLISLVAIEIHKTIFPILFLFILKKIRPTWTLLISVIALSIALAHTLNLDFFFNAIALYDSGYEGMDASGSGYSQLLLDIGLTLGVFYCLRRNLTERNALMINALCMATCIQAFAPVFSLTTRMTVYFTILIVILLPEIPAAAFAKSSRKLVTACIAFVCLLYFQVFVMTPSNIYEDGVKSNSQRTIPYRFCWQSMSH